MSSDPGSFQEVCRLLALKRHEQPTPGYFDRFSSQVISRLRAGEHLKEPSFFEWLGGEGSWVQWFRTMFETKPVLAGAFGIAICGLLVSGIINSERMEPVTVSLMPVAPQAVTRAFQVPNETVAFSRGYATPSAYVDNGSASALQLRESLFRPTRGPAQLVSFPAGN